MQTKYVLGHQEQHLEGKILPLKDPGPKNVTYLKNCHLNEKHEIRVPRKESTAEEALDWDC